MRIWSAIRVIVIDRAFAIAALAAAGSAVLLYEIRGLEAVRTALRHDVRVFTLLFMFVPSVLLLASFVEVMLPRALVERWLGVGSGLKGIVVSSLAGMFTPGGPFLAFPLVLALYRAGADWAPLIAYVTAWSMNSVARILVFEIPFVGVQLPAVRLLACFALPPIAGYTARWIATLYRPPPESPRR